MELSIGTEVREEYLSWEVGGSARKLVEEVMLTQPGENVVITADTSSDMRVVQATATAAYAAGAIPTVVLYPTQKTAVMEPPPPVAGTSRQTDVWIQYAVAYLLHTQAYKEGLKNGAITEVKGSVEAKIFEQWLAHFNDPNMYRIAHYSLGFNPGVTQPTGRIVEDERVFGCIEMGIGSQGAQIMGKTWSAASHTDGVVFNPTILLDGVAMEKEGIYQLESLREVCRDLGIPGY